MIYKSNNKRGFTLVELLIVVAIIGILSTTILTTLGGARERARDSSRHSDVKQMVLILTLESTSVVGSRALLGCTGDLDKTTTCTGVSDGAGGSITTTDVAQFPNFKDPVAKGAGSACTSASTGTCDYSISTKAGAAGAETGDYQICFYLEKPEDAGFTEDDHVISAESPSGNLVVGCN